jgi:ATP-binding cassette, subfamily B, bacterial MsbA
MPRSFPAFSLRLVYQRLLGYLLPYWKLGLLSLASMTLAAGTEPAFAWLMKPLMDQSFRSAHGYAVVGGHSTWLGHFLQQPYGVPLAIILVFILRGGSSYINDYSGTWLSTQLVLTLRKALFERILHFPVTFFDQHSTGRLVSHVLNDVNQVSEAGFNVITVVVKDSLTVLGLLAILMYTDWRLTAICAVLLPTVSVGVRIVNRKLRYITQDWQYQMGELTQTLNESFQSQRQVKLFNGYAHQGAQFDEASRLLRRSQLRQIKLSSTYTGVVQWLVSLALALIIYLASQRQSLTAGDFMSFVTAMLMLFPPVKRLTNVHQALERGLSAAAKVFELIDSPSETNEGKRAEVILGSIRFDQVVFQYPTRQEPALDHVSFSVQAGETVGIVGISGSGKSTILQLLARFYAPTQGALYLDGHFIEEYDLHFLRNNIALVSQDITLFNDTIAANIAYGIPENQISMEAVRRVAEQAQALAFIESLPHGFETHIGEDGQQLSGGQRQRLAIARALLKQAPILVLDEATSALDAETELAFQEALVPLMKGRTTLMIAHRLSTVQHADRLLVFRQGKIVEEGRHEVLLQQKGEYARLWNSLKKEAPAPI